MLEIALWLVPTAIIGFILLRLHIFLWQQNKALMTAYFISFILMHLAYPIGMFINFELGVGIGVMCLGFCMIAFWGGLFKYVEEKGLGFVAILNLIFFLSR